MKPKPALVWDAWNKKHIGKHKVTIAEAKEVYSSGIVSSAKRGREFCIGEIHNGRIIVIFLSYERQKRPYVVSARDANKKERSVWYEKTKQF